MRKFPNIRDFAWNSSFAEKWNTTVQKSASGRVRTLTNQLYPAWTITASNDNTVGCLIAPYVPLKEVLM